jgi:hypothetical protein
MDFEINPKVIIVYGLLLLFSIGIALESGIAKGLIIGSLLGLLLSVLILDVTVE